MSDGLKEYVNRKPDDFDVFPFDEEAGWEQIANKIPATQPRRSNPWMYVAAGVTLLLMGAVWLLVRQANSTFSGEFFETEAYYQEMVDTKLASVKGKVDTELIIADFQEMDQAFAELKSDLKDDVDNQEVVEAMIANYRLKLKILERIVSEFEEENHDETRKSL